MKSDEFDLINLMVEETFKLADTIRFDSQRQLSFSFENYSMSYDVQRRCYILDLVSNALEIPENWGAAQTFRNKKLTEKAEYHIFKGEDEGLIELMENLIGKNIGFLTYKPLESHLEVSFLESKSNKIAA